MIQQNGTHQTKVAQVSPAAVHTLYSKGKRLKHLGVLSIIQKADHSYWFVLNHHTSYQILKKTLFLKLVYEHYTSYLFDAIKGGFVAISVKNGLTGFGEFEGVLRKEGEVMQYKGDIESIQLRKKIEYHCPGVFENSIHVENFMTPMFSLAGNFENRVFSAFDWSVNEAGDNKVDNERKQEHQNVGGVRGLWRNTVVGIASIGHGIRDRFRREPSPAPNPKEEIKPQLLKPHSKKKHEVVVEKKQNEQKKIEKEFPKIEVAPAVVEKVEEQKPIEPVAVEATVQSVEPPQQSSQEQQKTPEQQPRTEQVNAEQIFAKQEQGGEEEEENKQQEQSGKRKKGKKNKNKNKS